MIGMQDASVHLSQPGEFSKGPIITVQANRTKPEIRAYRGALYSASQVNQICSSTFGLI